MRSRIEGLTGKISELEGANATQLSRIRDLEKQVCPLGQPGLMQSGDREGARDFNGLVTTNFQQSGEERTGGHTMCLGLAQR